MKFKYLILAAALSLPTLSTAAETKLADFPLADRIKAKIESGKPLDIYVSYHDVSNEFAPFMKAGVEKAAAADKVAVSAGLTEYRSMTRALIPSSFSWSAAARQPCRVTPAPIRVT